ncbi:M50 family metallopeptidase [Collinsella provencensis]|uniref:M50 family metallopeptidase n=1 Tax=Collinsella provencensis TaxID=1937461 RepID=UPI000C8439A6|nr:site-2 protease family protein [Collinsella provencensis]
MDYLLGILGPLFWGLLLLSVIVFLHEGGHFLAARACGVRVSEFFLGLPCKFNINHVSRRMGTKFGVTPLLLGGYAAICGMDPTPAPWGSRVLALVHRHGTISAWDAHRELGLSADELSEAVYLLQDWGSITTEEIEPSADHPEIEGFSYVLRSVPRDAQGNTLFDGRLFDRANATQAGEVWEPPMDDEAFYAQERSRTYQGKGFWKRAFMLVAGIAVNIVTGFLFIVMVYSVIGVDITINTNELGAVTAGSPADQAGLHGGDSIISIDGVETDSWLAILDELDAFEAGDTVQIEFESADGEIKTVPVELDDAGMIGISVKEECVRLNPFDSCSIAVENIVLTARSIASLINPQHTKEVLDNSTSVVGISILSAQAASAGVASFLNFAALISFSLGFMNLLPIPPLDGGKLVIEIVQAILHREVSLKVQTILSFIGVGLFMLLFIYMLRADIIRFFL